MNKLRDILIRLGLVIEFEYSFDVHSNILISNMHNNIIKKNQSVLDNVLGVNNFYAKECKFENNRFLIIKESSMNPFVGRGLINGDIIDVNNSSIIKGEVVSNYRELMIIPYSMILILFVWLPFRYFNLVENISILIGLAAFLILSILLILQRRFEAHILKKSFIKFLNKINN